jgi:hypothetical protein
MLRLLDGYGRVRYDIDEVSETIVITTYNLQRHTFRCFGCGFNTT